MQDDQLTCVCGHRGHRHSDLDLDALGPCYDCECDFFLPAVPGMYRTTGLACRTLGLYMILGAGVWAAAIGLGIAVAKRVVH